MMRLTIPVVVLAVSVNALHGGLLASSVQPRTPPQQAPTRADALLPVQAEAFTGDLNGMIKRRIVRAGVAHNKTHYFIDRGVQLGAAYESLKLFEDELNKGIVKATEKVHVVFTPMSRDELLPALVAGRIDLVAAQLTVTPDRQALVDFTDPVQTNVNEIVVTGPGAPPIATKADLPGREVFVRKSSSYYESLVSLNGRLKAQGKPEVILRPAPETLEDEDLLEMVNAGLVPIVVVDSHVARLWAGVLPKIQLHPDVALRVGGTIAVAIRKHSPELLAAGNAWIKKYGPRTMFGNLMLQRYVSSSKFVKDATAGADFKRFQRVLELFQKYSARYELDYLLVAAQGYQESGLDQSVKSRVGAVGVMQVMPQTGAELKVGDIRQLEPNIHAGVKYIRFMIDTYYKDDPMDPLNKTLFAFASYNAGPNRIKTMRSIAQQRGLNPNLWFNNVERVVSEEVGRETVTYVGNIFKYYVAYSLAMEQVQARLRANDRGRR